jgi:hypothetical protein
VKRQVFVAFAALIGSALLGIALPAATAPPAHAACYGSSGGPSSRVITRLDNSGSYIIGQEAPVYPGSTCDGDYYYSGAVLDAYDDGSCITAYYLEPLAYYAAQGTACTTHAWSFYSYTDVYGPNSDFINVKATYTSIDVWWESQGY